MSKGTPKTLWEAISNGLAEAKSVIMGREEAEELAREVRPHVVDFIAQKFGPFVMGSEQKRAEEILKLFRTIKGGD